MEKNELYELHALKPEEVQISVFAKTTEQKTLAKIVNEKANEFLKKTIEYANWLKSQENNT